MMPGLILKTIPNSYIWEVWEDYRVVIRGRLIIIPKGFKTDLASVPRIFQNIFPSDGKYKECAVVHDYLLECGGLRRGECDRVFYHAMVDNGIKPLTAAVLFAAVRLYTHVKRHNIL